MNQKVLPTKISDLIAEARKDIANIQWDEGYYEEATSEWLIPVEALFTADDGFEPAECGWHYGTLRIEYDGDIDLLDYFVGDWTPGMHPDLNTDRR